MSPAGGDAAGGGVIGDTRVRTAPLGVIAGGGSLPVRIAQAAQARGQGCFVIALSGFAHEADMAAFPHLWAGIGEIGKMIKALEGAGCREITFAGDVKRPDFSKLKVDFTGARLLPAALKAASKGDDALLRVILGAFDKAGFTIVGAEEASGSLKATAGPIGALAPQPEHADDMARAFLIAQVIGAHDIGQGAVVCDGLVLAVEAQEGTDAMLTRTAGLPMAIRGTEMARRGVLAKIAKPVQERRVDLPTIGARTVEGAAAAGLAGIAVEVGGALIIDRDAVAATADAAGVFVVGVASQGIPRP